MVERHRIAYHEKKFGQLFCDGFSQQIIQMLLQESEKAGVSVLVKCNVTTIQKKTRFELATNLGELECQSVVIATGGLSIPKIGATDFGYRIARQFGIAICETWVVFVPLTIGGDEGRSMQELSGVSLDAVVSCSRVSFCENVLFTH